MTVHNVENKSLHLGGNIYAAGALSVPASTTYKAGMLLGRSGEGFTPAVDGGASPVSPIAVLGFDAANTTSGAVTKNVSAVMSGKVRHDMLFYTAASATPLSAAQCDALRDYGIVAIKVADVSQLDNQ